MHRSHLTLCAIGVGVALLYVATTGGSPGGVGVLVAALICPVAMVLAMKLLMGGHQTREEPDRVPPVVPTTDGEVP